MLLAVALGLFIVVMLVPRLMALDRLVTSDEPFWLGRSANFYQALASGNLADTYQFVHPGVTVMWLGALGYVWAFPSYPSEQGGQIDPFRPPISGTLQRLGHDPLRMLVVTRVVTILASTIALAVALWIATRLLGLWVAALGFLLLALEPFLIGHGRLLHVDELMTSFVLLSVVALLAYLFRGRHRYDLMISSVAAGLAWLTRSPALFLVPFTGLMFAINFWPCWRARRRLALSELRYLGQPFLLWFVVAVIVTVALWPALWLHPVETGKSVFGWALDAATEGHERNLFFRGRIIDGDPGWLFYPVTYLWRATPVTQIGLLLVGLGLVLPQTRIIRPSRRRPLVGLLLFALPFMAFMSLGAKKFDRYILPSYALLDLAAAAGWFGALHAIYRGRSKLSGIAKAAAAGVIVLAQAAGAASAYPYYLSYYNPLLGGTTAAEHSMLVGWGEGMDQVADFIKAQPDGDEAKVRTDAWHDSLAFYLPNEVRTAPFAPNMTGVLRWAQTDYLVTYVTMWQRDTIAPELQDYLNQQEPVFTVAIQGLTYAQVYDLRNIPLPDWFFQDHHCVIDFGGQLRLVTVDLADEQLQPGQTAHPRLYFETVQIPDREHLVQLNLISLHDNRVLATTERMLRPAAQPGLLASADPSLALPVDVAPGEYRFELRVLDTRANTFLPATDLQTSEQHGPVARLDC